MQRDTKGRSNVYQLRWTRWTAYRFVAEGPQMGWVYPSGALCEEYDPTQERHLPEALALVSRRFKSKYSLYRKAREHFPLTMLWRPIEEFLHQFGFLGQLQLTSPHSGAGQVWKKAIDGQIYIFPAAEQWQWILDHAENVDRCLSLAGTMDYGSFKELDTLIRDYETMSYRYEQVSPKRARRVAGSMPRTLYIPTLTETKQPVQTSTLYKEHAPPAHKVKAIIKACLDPNTKLDHMARVYDLETDHSVFQCAALIQVIYQQLADRILREQLRECQECHGWFFAHHGQQVFCPPQAGSTESRCGRRARERIRRQKARSSRSEKISGSSS